MASTMQDLDDELNALEAATDAVVAAQAASESQIQAVVDALVAKLPPGMDTSSEVGRIKTILDKQKQAAADLQNAADAVTAKSKPTPPPPPPPPFPQATRTLKPQVDPTATQVPKPTRGSGEYGGSG